MGCIKSKEKDLPSPWSLSSNSRQEWISWRNCFLTYMTQTSVPRYKQGHEFFYYIGNVGLEISRNFYYPTCINQADVDTILFKFDVYFTFGGRKRHADESIKDYVEALKNVAEKTAKKNTDKVIKEKILQDLMSEKVFEHFLNVAPSFSKVMNYESLELHELLFIWEECKKSTSSNDSTQCLQCGRNHQKQKCSANGQKCWKCKNYNHFARCCTENSDMNCENCGSNHVQGKCPAFGKECSQCKKLCHFAWQCYTEIVISCEFCEQTHIYNRQNCPAKDSRCNNCNKVGHFSFKYRKNSTRKK